MAQDSTNNRNTDPRQIYDEFHSAVTFSLFPHDRL
jgi:hypothetical protein